MAWPHLGSSSGACGAERVIAPAKRRMVDLAHLGEVVNQRRMVIDL